MTTPQPQPLVDTGNSLLGETPAMLYTALTETPAGQRLALTIRTNSTTITVFLAADDAKAWARNLSDAAGMMSAAGLIIANGHLTS